MIFLHFFEASAGLVFGTLAGVALFVLALIQGEEWLIRYTEWKWERWWRNR